MLFSRYPFVALTNQTHVPSSTGVVEIQEQGSDVDNTVKNYVAWSGFDDVCQMPDCMASRTSNGSS